MSNRISVIFDHAVRHQERDEGCANQTALFSPCSFIIHAGHDPFEQMAATAAAA